MTVQRYRTIVADPPWDHSDGTGATYVNGRWRASDGAPRLDTLRKDDMAWIDDRIWCHPKFVDLSGDAFAAYVKGVAYSAGFATAGHLSPGQLKAIGARPKDCRALLAAGLWEPNGNGIVIHDWDEHNGKRDARRAADRERKRRQRKEDKSSGES